MKSTNGFRVPPAPSKNEQMRTLETEVKNLAMAGRISQMMVQQLLQNNQTMGQDLGNALNQLYELQYKYSALQKYLNADAAALDKIANEQRLIDFNAGTIEADKKEGLLKADTISADSTVVITSVAKNESGADAGIFRSRLKLSESGVPDLISGLAGKKVGDKVNVKLNGLDHEVEILGVSTPAQVEVAPEAQH